MLKDLPSCYSALSIFLRAHYSKICQLFVSLVSLISLVLSILTPSLFLIQNLPPKLGQTDLHGDRPGGAIEIVHLRSAWWRGEWHDGVRSTWRRSTWKLLWNSVCYVFSYGCCGRCLVVLVAVFCGSCGGGFLVVLVVTGAMVIMFGGCLVHLGMGGGFLFGLWFRFDSCCGCGCGCSVWP